MIAVPGSSTTFGRNSPEGDELSIANSQSKPQPKPEGGNPLDGAKEKERSTSPSPSSSTAPATQSAGLEKEEIGRIKVNQFPESKEDADDDDDNKHGHEMADDSIFRYPRSPSFREYCTDPEIRFGVDSGPDSDGDDDMDSHPTSRKQISKSTMSSPNTQDKPAGLDGESATELAKDDSKGRFTATGLKIRNVLGNKWGRSTQGRSLRSYFQVSNWHRPAYFTRSSVAKAE